MKKFIYESVNASIAERVKKVVHEREKNYARSPVLLAHPRDPPKGYVPVQISGENFAHFMEHGYCVQKGFIDFALNDELFSSLLSL